MPQFTKRLSGLVVGTATVWIGTASLMPAIATAPLPPSLVPAVLGGKPAYILNMTRSGDRVAVRCYPGYQPRVSGGVLTCGQ